MQFLTIRELSKSPKETLSRLDKDGKAVLTNNGRPTSRFGTIISATAAALLAIIPIMVLYIILQKCIIKGMVNGP